VFLLRWAPTRTAPNGTLAWNVDRLTPKVTLYSSLELETQVKRGIHWLDIVSGRWNLNFVPITPGVSIELLVRNKVSFGPSRDQSTLSVCPSQDVKWLTRRDSFLTCIGMNQPTLA
jgi:hypothetical protein